MFLRNEGILNSRCRRLHLLLFAVFAQSVAAMTAIVAALTGRWRSTVTGTAGSFNSTLAQRLDSAIVFRLFQNSLGQTEMRTRERKDRQLIRTEL